MCSNADNLKNKVEPCILLLQTGLQCDSKWLVNTKLAPYNEHLIEFIQMPPNRLSKVPFKSYKGTMYMGQLKAYMLAQKNVTVSLTSVERSVIRTHGRGIKETVTWFVLIYTVAFLLIKTRIARLCCSTCTISWIMCSTKRAFSK